MQEGRRGPVLMLTTDEQHHLDRILDPAKVHAPDCERIRAIIKRLEVDSIDSERVREAAKGVIADFNHFKKQMAEARAARDSRLRDLVETQFVACIKGSLPVLLLAIEALSTSPAPEKACDGRCQSIGDGDYHHAPDCGNKPKPVTLCCGVPMAWKNGVLHCEAKKPSRAKSQDCECGQCGKKAIRRERGAR